MHPTDNSSQTLTTTLQTSCTPSPHQTLSDDEVTSTVPTSNPNPEIPDDATNIQAAVSVSSSLPSSNTFSVTTSTSMSSGVTADEVASLSSTPSIPLQQSSVGKSKQMGMTCTMAGDSSGTGLTNQQPDPKIHTVEEASVKPGSMDHQMQPVQVTPSWRQDVSPDLRQHLVRKLVTTINPNRDQNALQDDGLIQQAKNIEESMFELAQNREQYYELLAEKIYKLQKELEEKINKEMYARY